MSEIKNGRLDLDGMVLQFEELGFSGLKLLSVGNSCVQCTVQVGYDMTKAAAANVYLQSGKQQLYLSLQHFTLLNEYIL